jgi:hypothetical protein
MDTKMEAITINNDDGTNIKFIRENCVENNRLAEKCDGLEYAILRTRMFGVMAGYVKHAGERKCVILNGRRLWKFSGAETLEEVAVYGASNVAGCKFGPVSPRQEIHEDYALIYCTAAGKEMIQGTPVWKK